MSRRGKIPVFLDLRMIHFPVGAVISILHRITGVLLVLAIPVLISMLQLMNSGEQGFNTAVTLGQSIPGKLLTSLIIWILIQHTVSGVRHLMMDLDYGYAKQAARNTARLAFVTSLLLIIASGWIIWR